jgi:ketosteroid isomerase-like protein
VSEATVQVVREAYALLHHGDPRRLLDLMAADATWEPATDARVRPSESGEELAKTFMWRGALHRLRARELIDVGDRVVVRLGGRRLTRLGAPRWTRQIFQVVTVRDGRIVLIRDYATRDEAFTAVGLTT